METLDTVRRLFEFDHWADREALASLRAATAPPERAVSILAHVAGAKLMWLARILGEALPDTTWPELDLDALARQFDELAARWRAFLNGLGADDLRRDVSYKNTKGEAFTNPLGDLLLQVALHGSYHRGQVAVLLREAGKQPSATDYIRAVRLGVLR